MEIKIKELKESKELSLLYTTGLSKKSYSTIKLSKTTVISNEERNRRSDYAMSHVVRHDEMIVDFPFGTALL